MLDVRGTRLGPTAPLGVGQGFTPVFLGLGLGGWGKPSLPVFILPPGAPGSRPPGKGLCLEGQAWFLRTNRSALPLSARAAPQPAGPFWAETGTRQGRLLLPSGLRAGRGWKPETMRGDVKRKSDEWAREGRGPRTFPPERAQRKGPAHDGEGPQESHQTGSTYFTALSLPACRPAGATSR